MYMQRYRNVKTAHQIRKTTSCLGWQEYRVPQGENWSWDSWDGQGQILKDIVYKGVRTWFCRWESLKDGALSASSSSNFVNCVPLSCFLPIVLTLFSFCLSRGMFLHPLQGYFEMCLGFFFGGCYIDWGLLLAFGVYVAEAGIINNLQCLVQSLHWRTVLSRCQ